MHHCIRRVVYFALAARLASTPCIAETLAADAADTERMVALAIQYEHAEGVARDYGRAAMLYCGAARQGSAAGLFGLGWMYANGRGVPIEEGFAARLIAMAADAGSAEARLLKDRIRVRDGDALPPCMTPRELPAGVASQVGELRPALGNVNSLRIVPPPEIRQLVAKLAPKYQIDPNLALAIMLIESGFNVNAISPKKAQGLMQLMPATATRFNVRNAFDAEDNIRGGLAYLRWLCAYFKGNVAFVVAAYNAGEHAVERFGGVPPYTETKAYVTRFFSLYQHRSHPYDETITSPSRSQSMQKAM